MLCRNDTLYRGRTELVSTDPKSFNDYRHSAAAEREDSTKTSSSWTREENGPELFWLGHGQTLDYRIDRGTKLLDIEPA